MAAFAALRRPAAAAIAIVFCLEVGFDRLALLLSQRAVVDEDFREVADKAVGRACSPNAMRDAGRGTRSRRAFAEENAIQISRGRATDVANGQRTERAGIGVGLGAQGGASAEFINAKAIAPHGDRRKGGSEIMAEKEPLAGLDGAAAGALGRGPPDGDEGEIALPHVGSLDKQTLAAIEADAGMAGEGIGDPQGLGRGGVLIGIQGSGERIRPLADAVGGVLGDVAFGGEPEDQASGDGRVSGNGWVWLRAGLLFGREERETGCLVGGRRFTAFAPFSGLAVAEIVRFAAGTFTAAAAVEIVG